MRRDRRKKPINGVAPACAVGSFPLHEVHTPLQAILGAAELLLSAKSGDSATETAGLAREIVTAARALEDAVGDLALLAELARRSALQRPGTATANGDAGAVGRSAMLAEAAATLSDARFEVSEVVESQRRAAIRIEARVGSRPSPRVSEIRFECLKLLAELARAEVVPGPGWVDLVWAEVEPCGPPHHLPRTGRDG